MRFWQAIIASVLVHAALLNIPIGMSSVREAECVEMRFIIEAAPAAAPTTSQPADLPLRAAVQPMSETPPETVKAPPMPRLPELPKKKVAPRPKVDSLPEAVPPSQIEPAPAVDDARPADISMPQPAPPAEAVAAADTGGAPDPPAGGSSAQQQAAAPGGRSAGYGVGPAAFGGSGGPGFLRRVLPRYPRLAREMGREGTVVLSLTIDANGILQDAEVMESAGFGFDEEALRALQASSFKAAVRNGKPVASRALLPVRFMLRGSGDD
jgi:protein TonB